MGLVVCRPSDEAVGKSKKIDCELKRDEFEQQKKVKMLLLGTSDSGKSTIVKQMRLIHTNGFNDTEIINAIFQIRLNIIESFKAISNIMLESNDIEVIDSEQSLVELFAFNTSKIELMQEADELNLLNTIRFYACVKEFFRIYKTHPAVPDNIYYFFPELARILLPNFTPTNADIVHMRVATLGVHEISFDYRKFVIRLIDVGGQKTERRKWIHFFEGVTAVMFIASLSCFDQFVEDEPKQITTFEPTLKAPTKIFVRAASKSTDEKNPPKLLNRLDDSIELFASVQRNNFLHKSSYMLFLNKRDVLREKLKTVQLGDYFKAYTEWFNNNNDYESASEFIENLFRKEQQSAQTMYTHFTEATDKTNIEFVFVTACDIILQQNLQKSGLS